MNLKYVLISGFLILLFPSARSQTTVVSDSVMGNWSENGSPYIITQDITVPSDTSLLIEGGCEILFTGPYSLRVMGKLVADGSIKKRIVFGNADSTARAEYLTTADTVNFQMQGWRGIRFANTRSVSDTSKLNFCILKGASAISGNSADCLGGAVQILGEGMVIINHSSLMNNSAHLGGAIYCENSHAEITRNIVENNVSISNGGGICLINCKPIVADNIIRLNSSPEFGGGIYCEKTSGTFTNNIISENIAGFGGAVSLLKSDIRFLNNTIADNACSQNGGGIHCRQSSPYLKNSILWGNQAQGKGTQMYLFEYAYPQIIFSDIQGGREAILSFKSDLNGVSVYSHNLEDDPAVIKNDSDYYSLSKHSPCIDVGLNQDPIAIQLHDQNGRERIINKIIDMGAKEFALTEDKDKKMSSTVQDDQLILDIKIYPNPNDGHFGILVQGVESNKTNLVVVNLKGQCIYNQSLYANNHTINTDIVLDVDRGIYFIDLFNSNNELIKREKLVVN